MARSGQKRKRKPDERNPWGDEWHDWTGERRQGESAGPYSLASSQCITSLPGIWHAWRAPYMRHWPASKIPDCTYPRAETITQALIDHIFQRRLRVLRHTPLILSCSFRVHSPMVHAHEGMVVPSMCKYKVNRAFMRPAEPVQDSHVGTSIQPPDYVLDQEEENDIVLLSCDSAIPTSADCAPLWIWQAQTVTWGVCMLTRAGALSTKSCVLHLHQQSYDRHHLWGVETEITAWWEAPGIVLCDPIGTGKTATAICIAAEVLRRDPHDGAQCLVVVPAHIIEQWCSEIRRVYPELRILTLKDIWPLKRLGVGELDQFNFVVCSPRIFESSVYKSNARTLTRLHDSFWRILILDEVQDLLLGEVRFPLALTTLRRRHTLAITATPPLRSLQIQYFLDCIFHIDAHACTPCIPQGLGTFSRPCTRMAAGEARKTMLSLARRTAPGGWHCEICYRVRAISLTPSERLIYEGSRRESERDNAAMVDTLMKCCHHSPYHGCNNAALACLKEQDQRGQALRCAKTRFRKALAEVPDELGKRFVRDAVQNLDEHIAHIIANAAQEVVTGDCDSESLAVRIIHIRSSLKALETAVQNLDYFQRSLEKLLPSSSQYMLTECAVCLTIPHALDNIMVHRPCGHTICTECWGHMRRTSASDTSRCCYCRRAIILSESLLSLRERCSSAGVSSGWDHERFGSKLSEMLGEVEKALECETNRVLVFLQFATLVPRVLDALSGIPQGPACYLHGTAHTRTRLIHEWKEGTCSRVLILSLEESASGAHLPQATDVIFVHPPMASGVRSAADVHAQAVGRAVRPGRVQGVRVTYLVAKGTVEEKLQESLYPSEHSSHMSRQITC